MPKKDSGNILWLGVDLGTAQTAVVSHRHFKGVIPSVVGFPRDRLSAVLLHRAQSVGKDAIEKQVYLDLLFPMECMTQKKLSDKENEALRVLLKHVVGLTKPRIEEKVHAIIALPPHATREFKERLLQIAEEIMNKAMVVSAPFMVAYGFSRFNNAIIIDVGANSIDMCAMTGCKPTLDNQLTLLNGGNRIDRLLADTLAYAHPGIQVGPDLIRQIKETHAFVGPPGRPLRYPVPVNGVETILDMTKEMGYACETLLTDIVEGVRKLLQLFPPDSQEEVLRSLILAGGCSQIHGLGAMIENQLEDYGTAQVFSVADAYYSAAFGALKAAQEVSPEFWYQLSDLDTITSLPQVPALGYASSPHRPISTEQPGKVAFGGGMGDDSIFHELLIRPSTADTAVVASQDERGWVAQNQSNVVPSAPESIQFSVNFSSPVIHHGVMEPTYGDVHVIWISEQSFPQLTYAPEVPVESLGVGIGHVLLDATRMLGRFTKRIGGFKRDRKKVKA